MTWQWTYLRSLALRLCHQEVSNFHLCVLAVLVDVLSFVGRSLMLAPLQQWCQSKCFRGKQCRGWRPWARHKGPDHWEEEVLGGCVFLSVRFRGLCSQKKICNFPWKSAHVVHAFMDHFGTKGYSHSCIFIGAITPLDPRDWCLCPFSL